MIERLWNFYTVLIWFQDLSKLICEKFCFFQTVIFTFCFKNTSEDFVTSRNPNPENCGSLRLLGAGNEDVYSSSIVLGTTSVKRNTIFQKLSTSKYIYTMFCSQIQEIQLQNHSVEIMGIISHTFHVKFVQQVSKDA